MTTYALTRRHLIQATAALAAATAIHAPAALAQTPTDGDLVTVTVNNLPPGAVWNARAGSLDWTPSYDQAGVYRNVTVLVTDGVRTTFKSFSRPSSFFRRAPSFSTSNWALRKDSGECRFAVSAQFAFSTLSL